MIQKLKNLKEEMRQYTHNELLAEIDSEKLRVIIQHSKNDDFLKKKIKKIDKMLNDAGIDHSEKWKGIYSNYSESLVYIEVGSRVSLKRREERAKQGKQTSDFLIEYKDIEIFAEFKALLRVGRELNYIEMINRGLNNAIYIEQEREKGTPVIVTELVHQPFKKMNGVMTQDQLRKKLRF